VKRFALLLALLLAACGCHVGLTPVNSANVAAACDRLRALHCSAGEPTPGGTTCEEVIRVSVREGLAAYDFDCLRRMKACSEESQCSRW
jgi:hypothetical protein